MANEQKTYYAEGASPIFLFKSTYFGVTIAILWALTSLIIRISGINSPQIQYDDQTISAILNFLSDIHPYHSYDGALGLIAGLISSSIYGFILGFLIGDIYNWRKLRDADETILSAAVNADTPVNVIKNGEGREPFTIVFVANPLLCSTKYDDGNNIYKTLGYSIDPIMNDRDLFFNTVMNCIQAFSQTAFFQSSDAFNKTRFIAVNAKINEVPTCPKECNNFSLCGGIDPALDFLVANDDMDILNQYFIDVGLTNYTKHTDIIYIISGSEQYIRSTAFFTEDDPKSKGINFKFSFKNDKLDRKNYIHAYYYKKPGIIALSALDERLKTPIHEFCHAISSRENGLIIDEYDDIHIDVPVTHKKVTKKNKSVGLINVKYRDNKYAPIPRLFARYKCWHEQIDDNGNRNFIEIDKKYLSDFSRRILNPESTIYVPERCSHLNPCIMGRGGVESAADHLLLDFLSDRLRAKVTR